MSISGALNNALTGLQAAGRASQVVSNNIANVLTPGYAVRRLELTSSLVGGGVTAVGITRQIDEQLLADRRIAFADDGYDSNLSSFHTQLARLVGTPDQPGSLNARLSDFEGALISAASRPDAPERLDGVLTAAKDLAFAINTTSNGIQEARTNADRAIDSQVTRLNEILADLEDLNGDIVKGNASNSDVQALQDSRQALVDELSKIVPVREIARDTGAIALYSTGGAVLLDGRAAVVEFSPSSNVTPYLSIDDATLSGLTLNGTSISTGSDDGMLRGGTLGAQFAIRDELAPEAQAQLDALSRDLIERFADPAVDPSLGVGDAGFFTDAGAAFDPLDEVGLSERLSVNALVDPNQGGELWRIRDGLGAAVPGNEGDASLLHSLSDALANGRAPASGNFGTGVFSALDLAATWQSQVAGASLAADRSKTFAATRLNEIDQLVLKQGVDTDAELQSLILIEQVYAANARVIEAADDMLQQLLRL